MPQPLPKGNSVLYGSNKILERPELAAEIGNVCANWNVVERNMMLLYAILMGDYLPKLLGSAPLAHPVAYQVFASLNAFAPRIELLEKLLVWRTSDITLKHFREEIRPKLGRRFSERSIIAHGVWAVCDKYPDALILVPTYGPHLIYKKRDFEDVSGRIIELGALLGKLTTEIYEQRNKNA